jgi:adenylate kinase
MMGAPGAGKGTQAKLLQKRLGVPHISTGDILREAVRAGTPLGREAQQKMEHGLLVPDDVVIGIVDERLGRSDCTRGFILDGFPRTVAQAQALDALLARRGLPLTAVVEVDVPRAELVQRISGRRVCQACGTLSHVRFDPPTTTGRCDRCAGTLVQRDDDREETVGRRLDVYARETAPVLEHYRQAGLLRSVQGTGSPDEVLGRIEESLR